jgi:NADH:ubiquinone oxidoreductase subunit K
MTTQAIDATIFASSHPDIAKRTSVSGLIFSCIMLLAGVIAFVSTFEMEDRSSTISMGLMVLGTALFLIGVFRLFWKSKEIVYLPTGSVAKEQSIFFDLTISIRSITLPPAAILTEYTPIPRTFKLKA